MRRMLDPKTIGGGGGGGLPSSVEFDKEGNRKLTKNLEVDGSLKFSSLVSDPRPTGEYPIIDNNVVLGSYYKYSTSNTLLYPIFGQQNRIYNNGMYALAFEITTFTKTESNYLGSPNYLQLLLWLHTITITATNRLCICRFLSKNNISVTRTPLSVNGYFIENGTYYSVVDLSWNNKGVTLKGVNNQGNITDKTFENSTITKTDKITPLD